MTYLIDLAGWKVLKTNFNEEIYKRVKLSQEIEFEEWGLENLMNSFEMKSDYKSILTNLKELSGT